MSVDYDGNGDDGYYEYYGYDFAAVDAAVWRMKMVICLFSSAAIWPRLVEAGWPVMGNCCLC